MGIDEVTQLRQCAQGSSGTLVQPLQQSQEWILELAPVAGEEIEITEIQEHAEAQTDHSGRAGAENGSVTMAWD